MAWYVCLLSSQSWYTFTDPGGMEGWVDLVVLNGALQYPAAKGVRYGLCRIILASCPSVNYVKFAVTLHFLQVDVFFGPCCDYAAAPVARQTRYWNVPMLTAAAMARDYAVNRRGEFPMLTRVGANFNSLAQFVVNVLQYFDWRRVMLVYNPQGHANEVNEPTCYTLR